MLLEDINEAEVWFRHVLSFAPFNRRATEGLAQVLVQTGDKAAARRLCQEYIERIGEALCAGFFISESP